MLECFKMLTCCNYPNKCYECNSMSDIFNHYPCYNDEPLNLNDIFEPVTMENIKDLKPGEWIWDNKEITRKEHKFGFSRDNITEPIGFRQIGILEESNIYPQYSNKPFMLSNFDRSDGGYSWTIFEKDRFYRFKKERK